jgi:hypothetical protein
MTRAGIAIAFVLLSGWSACVDPSSDDCAASACDDRCIGRGFRGGLCRDGVCACLGGSDAGCDPFGCDIDCRGAGHRGGLCSSTSCRCVDDSDAVADTADGVDAAAETGEGFSPTRGTQAAVDRTEPCLESELGQWRTAPQDPGVMQSCLPNYNVWAPVVCGNPLPRCACDDTACRGGEVAKPVNGGDFCICLNLCTEQSDAGRCGAADERDCIPVDDWSGTQVFICGGSA